MQHRCNLCGGDINLGDDWLDLRLKITNEPDTDTQIHTRCLRDTIFPERKIDTVIEMPRKLSDCMLFDCTISGNPSAPKPQGLMDGNTGEKLSWLDEPSSDVGIPYDQVKSQTEQHYSSITAGKRQGGWWESGHWPKKDSELFRVGGIFLFSEREALKREIALLGECSTLWKAVPRTCSCCEHPLELNEKVLRNFSSRRRPYDLRHLTCPKMNPEKPDTRVQEQEAVDKVARRWYPENFDVQSLVRTPAHNPTTLKSNADYWLSAPEEKLPSNAEAIIPAPEAEEKKINFREFF